MFTPPYTRRRLANHISHGKYEKMVLKIKELEKENEMLKKKCACHDNIIEEDDKLAEEV
jgi:hypothetical protein|tara:strand:- start:1546 stop:1722 length:177 start_codon:yes stop_codon:yes gene_type:complete